MVKLGEIFSGADNNDEALIYFTDAERLDGKNIAVKINIAKIYLSRGMLIRAENPLQKILKINPEHEEARELLRQCI